MIGQETNKTGGTMAEVFANPLAELAEYTDMETGYG